MTTPRPRLTHFTTNRPVAVVMVWIAYGDASWLFGRLPGHKPAGYGLPPPGVYAVWLLVVVSLYPLCRWFAGVKRRRSDWWLSYL